MKKFFSFFISLLICFNFFGCGNNNKSYENKSLKNITSEPVDISKGANDSMLNRSIYFEGDSTRISEKLNIAKNNPEIDLAGVKIVNPKTCEKTKEYANLLYELRKAKGMTEEQAYELTVNNEMFYGCLMLKSGDVDGLVGGATFSSADVLRSAFQVIKPAPGIKSVSSCFVIVPPEGNTFTDAPAMIFSDCAVIPEPDENQLADVAVAAADSARSIVGIEPKVAMLSFSTKGSAKHERIDKVVHALNIVKESHPELDIDGEMQLDAAIVPVVAKQKAPGSTVAGHANVLVFPNLESGNIGYKIAQRLGGYRAVGPLIQGLAAPMHDLSRGCSVQEIIELALVAAVPRQTKVNRESSLPTLVE